LQSTDGPEIKKVFQGNGHEFTRFVDDTLLAHAFRLGKPLADIHTNQQTNRGDGGVDTRFLSSLSTPTNSGQDLEFTGFFIAVGTVLQYKAQPISAVTAGTIAIEVNKDYAAERIRAGDRYGIVVCDTLTSDELTAKEKELQSELVKVNPQAAPGFIIDANRLSHIAGRYPSVVMKHLRPRMDERVLSLEAWQQTGVADLVHFVEVEDRIAVSQALKEHLNFSQMPGNGVQILVGDAGAGKTRLAYEVVRAVPGADLLLLYMPDDEKISEVLRVFLNSELHAVIVVDECSSTTIETMVRMLEGAAKTRVRCIAIQRPVDRSQGVSPELLIVKLKLEEVERVLEANFAHIPSDRRRAFAKLAGGYIRFATVLAQHDAQLEDLSTLRQIGQALHSLIERHVFSREDLAVLKLLSVVPKISRASDDNSIDLLIGWIGKDLGVTSRRDFEDSARRLHTSFVASTARWYYVTPEVVARQLFEEVCHQLRDGMSEVLDRMPPELLESFWDRAMRSGTEEVRARVAERFQGLAASISARDLTDPRAAKLIATLVETDAARFAPWLQRMIADATDQQILEIEGGSSGGEWNGRRILVWLTEKLSAFEEHFRAAESILLRFAINESEKNIGNNATAQWLKLFQIFRSGTEVPYDKRLDLLDDRASDIDDRVVDLACKALAQAFKDRRGLFRIDESTFAGKIKPEEWAPTTFGEYWTCQDKAAEVVLKHASSDRVRPRLQLSLAEAIPGLLERKRLDVLELLFDGCDPNEPIMRTVFNRVTWFIEHAESLKAEAEFVTRVGQWLYDTSGANQAGRIQLLIGDAGFSRFVEDKEKWEKEVAALARDLIINPDLLRSNFAFLLSGDAHRAHELGQHMGRQDIHLKLFNLLVGMIPAAENLALLAAYLEGVATAVPSAVNKINDLLDKLADTKPWASFVLATADEKQFRAFDRGLSLIESGALPIRVIDTVVLRRDSSEDDIRRLLRAISKGVSLDPIQRAGVLTTLWYAFEGKKEVLLRAGDIRREVINLMAPESIVDTMSTHAWSTLLRQLFKVEPAASIRIAVAGGMLRSLRFDDEASKFLAEAAKTEGSRVVEELGRTLQATDDYIKLHFCNFERTVAAIPPADFRSWLEVDGRNGALAIAPHLPRPSFENDVPNVHPNTALVLDQYESDDEVFKAFESGISRIEMWGGSGEAKYLKDAEMARKYINHPLRRVREWAVKQESLAINAANHFRIAEQDDELPF